jgi:hypothetical protein
MTLRLVAGGRYRLKAGRAVQLVQLVRADDPNPHDYRYWIGHDLDADVRYTWDEQGRYSAVSVGHDLDILKRIT